jgi:hypothetical protein
MDVIYVSSNPRRTLLSIHGADSTSSPSSGYIQIDSIIHDDDSTWHGFFLKVHSSSTAWLALPNTKARILCLELLYSIVAYWILAPR